MIPVQKILQEPAENRRIIPVWIPGIGNSLFYQKAGSGTVQSTLQFTVIVTGTGCGGYAVE